ncbi:hypothetical protein [Nocardioides mangrovicus]|uniref:hypothetical protein n=1 Tax=Nocardioides mangrovicus TaxID=2478913 RepID=UPI00131472AE|nr:hypothetical protein [Nocardioides mangrovicus]
MTNEPDLDAAWRSIVENYGERATLDDPPAEVEPLVRPQPSPQSASQADRVEEHDPAPEADPEDHFVPPEPPPMSLPEPPRLLAWAGVLGVPVLAVVLAVVHVAVPSWAGVLGLAWFVGGFGYLVATMRRGDDDDWDDGAVI